MGFRLGVDVGGSFTDFAILNDEDNAVSTLKVLSRPDAPGEEVLMGLSIIKDRFGIAPREIDYFTHGTTVGINTVIQRNGVDLGLITTRNFEDVLELARLKTPEMTILTSRRPEPLIPRNHVFAVDERLASDGSVLTPLVEDSVAEALDQALALGCDALVVALLHSYRNPSHEHEVKRLIAARAPSLPVFCSADVWPIIREYERTITASISAYVQPKVKHYLDRFEDTLAERGVPAQPRITRSNGGVMSVAQAKNECVQMILSGTASGVIGASFVAETCGYSKVLSFDVGGTSADVAVIIDGQPEYGVGEVIGEFQIHIPSVSVTSIGQGGGSIAWLDKLGVLKVGPESAGSSPGPACYGKGGDRPTLTDAFVVCGFVGHGDLGYSAIKVDHELSAKAVGTLADRMALGIRETAELIIKVAVSGMYADTSALVSRFGIDPRDYYLLAFGGAGPMTASFLARELNMKGVLVPPTPGVLSALGGLIADLKADFIKTLYAELDPNAAEPMRQAFSELRDKAERWLRDDQGFDGATELTYMADMRYRGQSFEVETRLASEWIETGDVGSVAEAFHRRHEELFDHADRLAPVQLISVRLIIAGKTPKPQLTSRSAEPFEPTPVRQVEVWFDGRSQQVPFHDRVALTPGASLMGPAIVGQADCTTCVPDSARIEVDRFGNLLIQRLSQED